jgi:hypothetical protein
MGIGAGSTPVIMANSAVDYNTTSDVWDFQCSSPIFLVQRHGKGNLSCGRAGGIVVPVLILKPLFFR